MMNKNSVIIKSTKFGLVVILDDKIPFHELIKDIEDKFKDASNFFKNAKMAVSFEGRELTKEEENEIIYTIQDTASIHILCVVDNDEEKEKYFKDAVDQKVSENATHDGQFYKGTLRSGQILEAETSIIILGDVNPGAQVVSKGNVIVLGSCKGTISAGAAGNTKSFVAALLMRPLQIRIGDFVARSTSKNTKDNRDFEIDPKIAFIRDGHIFMRPITKDVLGDISI
jgi:septum site-determining protein MinC